MERKSGISQKPSILVRSQKNLYGKPLNSPVCNGLLFTEGFGHLPGGSCLCLQNTQSYSHFISSSTQAPNGLDSLGAFACTSENDLHKWNESGGVVGLQLSGATKFLISDFEVPFSMVPAPKVAFYSDLYQYDTRFGVQELLGEQFVTLPQSGKDHGESGRVFSHPHEAYASYLPTAEVPNESCRLHEYRFLESDKDLVNQLIVESKMHNSVARVPGRTVMNSETLTSNFGALKKTTTDGASSLTIRNTGPFQVSLDVLDAHSTSHGNTEENPSREESSGSMHENTEDLEALMCFEEDEASTGRSPTEFTGNHPSEDLSSESSMDSSGGTYKRKSCESEWSEEDEVDILCQEAESELKEIQGLEFFDIKGVNSANPVKVQYCSPSGSLQAVVGRTSLSKSSALAPSVAICDTPAVKKCEAYSLVSGYSIVRKMPRAEKIKTTVKLLRNIIPGGNSMDTVDILGEAIQYVRSLQSKVSRLETNKRLKIM